MVTLSSSRASITPARTDLPAIAREPYSVTIDEPGDHLERLDALFESTGFWQEDAGAVAFDSDGLKGTIQFFRSGPCIHGYELGYVIHDRRERTESYRGSNGVATAHGR